YLVLANFYLVLFFTFYWVALRKQTFFRWNRAYLLAGVGLAFILPAVDISTWYAYPVGYPEYLIGGGEVVVVQGTTVDAVHPASVSWNKVLIGVYATGCVISFLFFLLRVVQTFQWLRTIR